MKTPVPCWTSKLLVAVAVLPSPLPLTVAVELPDREILLLNERLTSIRAWPPLTASSSAAPRVTGADSARASTETAALAAMAPTAMAETKIFFMTLPLMLCGAGAPRL